MAYRRVYSAEIASLLDSSLYEDAILVSLVKLLATNWNRSSKRLTSDYVDIDAEWVWCSLGKVNREEQMYHSFMPVCDWLIRKKASYYYSIEVSRWRNECKHEHRRLLYGSFNVCAILTKLSMCYWTKSFLSKERSLISTRIEPRLFLHDISHKSTENLFCRCRQKGESFPCWRVIAKSHRCIAAHLF
jgi:hypothetical protein